MAEIDMGLLYKIYCRECREFLEVNKLDSEEWTDVLVQFLQYHSGHNCTLRDDNAWELEEPENYPED